jgi:hypothetical protein
MTYKKVDLSVVKARRDTLQHQPVTCPREQTSTTTPTVQQAQELPVFIGKARRFKIWAE